MGCLSISNCKYIDLRGNNDADLTYGIKVINDATSQTPGSVWVYGKSDHIKISYLEITCEGNPSATGNGIFVNDAGLTSAWTFDTFEIHHNYIHDTRYAGMYLGNNNPNGNNKPWIARFIVHDNILEDLGTYGMVQKGINGGPNSFYNNFVDTTGLVNLIPTLTDEWRAGIRVRPFNNIVTVDVYDNTVFNTVGPGIEATDGAHNIYDNVVCGCGTGNDTSWGHGIKLYVGANGADVYDNIIIQPTRYGVYGGGSISNCTDSRNLISDAGIGARYDASSGGMTEGTGANANIYHTDVADFNFKIWSDDNNYSNDDFTFESLSTCSSQSGTCCPATQTCQGGSSVSSSDCATICCVGGTCEAEITCGDGTCNGDETCSTCLADCGACPAFLPEQYIEAEDGELVSPMQIENDAIASGGQYIFSNERNQGSVGFSFDIAEAREYMIEVLILSPDEASNSFFVGLNDESAHENDDFTFDTPESTEYTWDEVSLRGAGGDYIYSEFDPMVWDLTSGTHAFTFYGRETKTRLDKIILKKYNPSLPTDINSDDQVDLLDIQACVNVFMEIETNPKIVSRADVNEDETVNVLDIQEVVNVILE